MRCNNCGYENGPRNKYCIICGHILNNPKKVLSSQAGDISFTSLALCAIAYFIALIIMLMLQSAPLADAAIMVDLAAPPFISAMLYCRLEKMCRITAKPIAALAITNATLLVFLELHSGADMPLVSIIAEYLVIAMASFLANAIYKYI